MHYLLSEKGTVYKDEFDAILALPWVASFGFQLDGYSMRFFAATSLQIWISSMFSGLLQRKRPR